MIIDLNTKILDLPEVTNLNQLVFLSMLLDKNQTNNQNVRKIVSLISDDDITYLVQQKLVDSIERNGSITYQETDKLLKAVEPAKDYFQLLYDMYPIYIVRPDGSKCYLRANVNKCRHFFDVTTGKSVEYKEHIIKCLEFELNKRMKEGSLSYMKTMWRWLIDHQWEASEEEMQDVQKYTTIYGTDLI